MKKELLKRVRKVKEVYYILEPDDGHVAFLQDIPEVKTQVVKMPECLDAIEIPSRLFEDVYFLPGRLTVRRGNVVSRKCKPKQFQLLWHLDRFDGTADLENAALECLAKEIGRDITLDSMRINFYRIGDVFLELSIPASIKIASDVESVTGMVTIIR